MCFVFMCHFDAAGFLDFSFNQADIDNTAIFRKNTLNFTSSQKCKFLKNCCNIKKKLPNKFNGPDMKEILFYHFCFLYIV